MHYRFVMPLALVYVAIAGGAQAQSTSVNTSAGAVPLSAVRPAPAPLGAVERPDIRAQLMPRRYTTIAAENWCQGFFHFQARRQYLCSW